MPGKWVYMALAAFSGILATLEPGVISFLVISLGLSRVFYSENRKLVIFYIIFFTIFYVISDYVKISNVSHYQFPSNIKAAAITFKESPQTDGNRLRAIVVTPTKEKLMLHYKIPTESEKNELQSELRSGMTCMVDGKLVRPESNRNEHAFNYELFLKRMYIHWIFEADNISIENCSSRGTSLMSYFQNLRVSGIKSIEEKFPERLASYSAALIFGDRSLISDKADRSYKQLGIVHLLAISGLHVGIIAGGVFFLCLRIGMTRESVFWLLVILLPAYAVLSGGNPPVIRAVIMAILLLTSKKWRLPLSTLDIFSLSFLLFLFFDPFLIYHVGFQLSFSVSFALTMASAYLFHKNEKVIWQMINISITSTLSSFPILSYHFFEFSLVSIVANLIFVPFYTLLLLPAVFLLFAISFMEFPLNHLPAAFLDKVLYISESIAAAVGSFPYSVLLTGKPTTLSLIFMVGGILAFFISKERKIHLALCAMPLFIMLTIYLASIKYEPVGEVVFIDVGQGDSILIKLPYNQGVYMIDTGGQLNFPAEEWQERKKHFGVGKDILIPFLKSKGISRIDKLILTHSDTDHIGAATDLIDAMEIKEILISPNSWEKPLMSDVVKQAFHAGINVKEVKAGFGWENESGKFHFIYPFDDDYEGNDDSLVLYAKIGGLSWLFTGDLEKDGERELVSVLGPLEIDVLKVGHHGSRGSTSLPFIEMARPEYAVISAGKSNRYGHPHSEVLEILAEENVRILRTDEHGAIHYVFTAKGGTFRTVLPYDNARKHLQPK